MKNMKKVFRKMVADLNRSGSFSESALHCMAAFHGFRVMDGQLYDFWLELVPGKRDQVKIYIATVISYNEDSIYTGSLSYNFSTCKWSGTCDNYKVKRERG